jgi:pimeloyl-ACP methyl ester carboxylesterase
MRTIPIAAAFLVAVCGCASLPDTRTKQLDARRVEFVPSIRQTPAVVFENSLGGAMEWWVKVLPALDSDTTTFAYNRPGYGNSTAVDAPRDSDHIVAELRALLLSEGLQPPYVLVGHSPGGLYMQLFARRHPNEVTALVLVDATHPRQLDGDGAMEKQSFWVRGLVSALVTGTARDELNLLATTGDRVLQLPKLKDKPVFVLSASEPMKETSDLARFSNEKRVDIAKLYPGSHQIWVDRGHAIPLDRPEAVASAIKAALAESRALACSSCR